MGYDNFGLRIGIEGEKDFKKALADINQSFKVLGSEMQLVESAFDKQDKSAAALTARNEVLSRQIDAQKGKISTLEQALSNATASFGENDRRTQAWAIQLNRAKAALNHMEHALQENEQALQNAAGGLQDAEEQAEQFGDTMQTASQTTDDAESHFAHFGSALKGVGIAIGTAVAAIGAAAITAGASLISLGDDYNSAVNQLSASTGATGAALEQLGETAQNVYTHNFGDSLEDVADGLAVVTKTTGLVGQELEKATESGFALRDTFGYDLQESARTASALMKNFGVTAEEAYNTIAVGAQNGADQNGDLLDTLNEYSAQYAALGLSADEFMTGLVSGAETGVFSIDKVGDAVKEFNVRAKDGSASTMAAFSALGMNAEQTMADFAAGGDSAREAFFTVVDALDAMQDPMEKNSTAVALFGTMYEDLGSDVLPVLASMEDGAGSAYDALAQINANAVKYNNLDDALEGTKRSIQGVFLPAVSELSAGVTDAFSDLTNRINEADGDFTQISTAIGDTVGSLAELLLEQLPQFIQLGLDIVNSIGGAIAEHLSVILDAAVGIIMTILQGLIAALPQLSEGALQVILALLDGIVQNLPALVAGALQMVVTLAAGIGDALPELIPAIVDAVLLIVQTLLDNMGQILDAAYKIIEGLAAGLLAALPALIEALPQIIATMINFFVENLPRMLGMGVKLTAQLAVGLVQAIPQLMAQIPQIITAILGGLGGAVGSVTEIGGNIVRGLWAGIRSMGAWIREKVSDFFGGIVSSVKGMLGIHSPSTVFADIGGNMGKGVGVGFVQAMSDVEQEMQKAIPTDFDLSAGVSGIDAAKTDVSQTVTYQHTGTIRVEGINDKGMLTDVVDILLGQLRQEARLS